MAKRTLDLRGCLENVDRPLKSRRKLSTGLRHHATYLRDVLPKKRQCGWIIDERVNVLHVPSFDNIIY